MPIRWALRETAGSRGNTRPTRNFRMFRLLHKIYVLFCWLVVLAVVGALYQNRSLFYPLVDLVDALRIREGFEQKKTGELSGKVTRVLSGDILAVKVERGQTYTIRLTGVEAPHYAGANRAEQLRAGESKTNLSHLVLSKEVRVELTYTNQSRGAWGIVYQGNTNINLLAVETGIVRANRDSMNGLPLRFRYELIQADRRARERAKPE